MVLSTENKLNQCDLCSKLFEHYFAFGGTSGCAGYIDDSGITAGFGSKHDGDGYVWTNKVRPEHLMKCSSICDNCIDQLHSDKIIMIVKLSFAHIKQNINCNCCKQDFEIDPEILKYGVINNNFILSNGIISWCQTKAYKWINDKPDNLDVRKYVCSYCLDSLLKNNIVSLAYDTKSVDFSNDQECQILQTQMVNFLN